MDHRFEGTLTDCRGCHIKEVAMCDQIEVVIADDYRLFRESVGSVLHREEHILHPVTQFHRNFFANFYDKVPGIKRRLDALIQGKINLVEIARFRLCQLSN